MNHAFFTNDFLKKFFRFNEYPKYLKFMFFEINMFFK